MNGLPYQHHVYEVNLQSVLMAGDFATMGGNNWEHKLSSGIIKEVVARHTWNDSDISKPTVIFGLASNSN